MVGVCRNGRPGISVSGRAKATGGYVALTAIDFPNPGTVAPGQQDVNVVFNRILPPGKYGDISAGNNDTLTLTPGTYDINSLVLSGSSTLRIIPGGQVVLRLAGNNVFQAIRISNDSHVNALGMPQNLQVIYGGARKIRVTDDATVNAVLYAPNASVTLDNRVDWYGALVVGELDASDSAAIHYDRGFVIGPSITGAVIPTPNANGWNSANATVTFTCSEAGAPVLSCSPPVIVNVEGVQIVTGIVVDQAGQTATASVAVKLDKTAPVATARAVPGPNTVGWNNSNVVVTFTCTDPLSGVDDCPNPISVSNETASRVVAGTVRDQAGNTSTISLAVKVDKSDPDVRIVSPAAGTTLTASPAPVSGTVSDALSGVASVTCNGIPATVTGTTFNCGVPLAQGQNTLLVLARDVAGNVDTATRSIRYTPSSPDTAPPVITSSVTPTPNAAGWNKANATVTFTCSDAGSGIDTCSSPVSVTAENAGQTVTGTAKDKAGNTATASATVKLDKTLPLLAITAPAGGSTVTASPLSLTGTVSDALSGVAGVTCNGANATLSQGNVSCGVALVSGANTISVVATDVAGNARIVSVSVTYTPSPTDTTLPTISSTVTPTPNAAGWSKADTTVSFTCADAGSGIDTCSSPVTVTAETASQTITGTAKDKAGNTATTSATVKLDKTLPLLAITAPAGGSIVTASPVSVTGTVSDALSGVAGVTCNGANATLSQGNVSCSVALVSGANTITVAATDVAGNVRTSSVNVTYTPTSNDTTPPTISSAISPVPNTAGWSKADTTVVFACADGQSGIKTCSSPVIVTAETAGQIVTGTATDNAGNTATTSVTVKLDKTAPAIAVSTPANGASVTSATANIAGTVTDALSGVATFTCNGVAAVLTGPNFTCSATLTAGANAIAIVSADLAGNSRTVTLNVTLASPPTVSFTAPTPLSYLNITPTTLTGTVSDPLATVVINSIPAPVANGQFSIPFPLAEGPNIITATATSPSGLVGTSSMEVTLDTTPPHVTITSPPDGFVTTDTSATIAGIINDIVVGTVNDQQAQVTVNGVPAQVSNRTFLASSVFLNMGANVIQAVGRDRVGNQATTQITITRQAPSPSTIRLLSGNNQSGVIGSTLATPLVVALTDAGGNPVPNKPVIFKVTQNNGLVNSGVTPAASLIATTNPQGQAQVQWTLGQRAGAGSNVVEAYAVGFGGTAIFTASGTQGPAGKVVVDTGGDQIGPIEQALPKPLIAVVVDAGNNRLANVPVTFSVAQGGGSLTNASGTSFTTNGNGSTITGQPSITVTTDSDGRAAATPDPGQSGGQRKQPGRSDVRWQPELPRSLYSLRPSARQPREHLDQRRRARQQQRADPRRHHPSRPDEPVQLEQQHRTGGCIGPDGRAGAVRDLASSGGLREAADGRLDRATSRQVSQHGLRLGNRRGPNQHARSARLFTTIEPGQ